MRRSLLTTALLTACSPAAAVDGEACIDERFDAQPRTRLPVGETWWLPRLTADCGGAWTLGAAPKDSKAEVIAGADGVPRFTPDRAGDYNFRLGDQAIDLTVVPADAPFHNLNYYPAGSLALVGDELWAAEVYSPTIARLDPASLAVSGRISVGPWPVALAVSDSLARVVVVQRGGDTLGIVDSDTGRLVDAVWVGDEPAAVRVSPDGKTAYVALATESAIAVVDLEAAAVTARIDTVHDPLALALSPDGTRLYVARHRSGQPSRFPFDADPVADERDLDIIDTGTNKVVRTVRDIGTTITALLVSADGERLYVAAIRNDTEISQTEDVAFQNTIVVLDAATGDERLAVDLDTQAGAGGKAPAPHQMIVADDMLWVAIEGGDVVLGLDPETLEEVERRAAPGRPRSLVADGDAVYAHGAQSFTVTRISDARSGVTGPDPRPPQVAAGQALFTGAGLGFAEDRACNSCHADGLGDTVVWQAGPFPAARYVTRPLFWLEGTPLLGWTAYVTTIDNFAFGVTSNIGRRLDTDQQQGLAAYLASLMPPPPANGKTTRDGRLSEAAVRGEALFTGKAGCASCHPLPLTTSRALLADGLTAGEADIPALVGAYRHGVWMKHGEATEFPAAVKLALDYVGVSLSSEESADLTRYLEELTARDFILLASSPRSADELAAIDRPVRLTFSEPVWSDPSNLASITLAAADGTPIAADITADGRHVLISPKNHLAAGAAYTVTIDPAFESLRERPLYAATSFDFDFATAPAPTLGLDGDYTWTTMFPAIDIPAGGFNYDALIPTIARVTATPTASGARLAIDYDQGFVLTVDAIIAGDVLHIPAVPIAVGGSGVDGHAVAIPLIDDDADGLADRAVGTIDFTGPGMLGKGLSWDLARTADPSACDETTTGEFTVTVTPGEPATIDWGDAAALSVYVTDPQAALPTGPGSPVSNGATYWALQLETFPNGFLGPVTYGTVPTGAIDVTADVGGEAPGPATLSSGACYKFSVITTDGFATASTTMLWP